MSMKHETLQLTQEERGSVEMFLTSLLLIRRRPIVGSPALQQLTPSTNVYDSFPAANNVTTTSNSATAQSQPQMPFRSFSGLLNLNRSMHVALMSP